MTKSASPTATATANTGAQSKVVEPSITANTTPTTAVPAASTELAFSWDDPVKLMKSLSTAWREVTNHEIPTFLQLAQCKIERIDADVPSGFVAITVEGETHHAIGLRREAVAPLVTVLSKKPADEVNAALAKGPAKFQTTTP